MVCTAVVAGAGQKPSGDTDAWLDAVRTHEPGLGDLPLTTVMAMSPDQVEKSLRRFAEAEVPLLARAIVLHTDAALVERAAAEARGDDGTGRAVVISDGQNTGRRAHSRHWSYALGIADRLARRRTVAAQHLAALWFRAVSALLQQLGECGLLQGYVDNALFYWPADARLLLYRGTLHQTYADRRIQQFLAGARRPPGSIAVIGSGPRVNVIGPEPRYQALTNTRRLHGMTTPTGPTNRERELALAEADLRAALAIDESLVEARIRLAHVLSDRGQAEESASLAEGALATTLSPFFEVYASLVRGRSAFRLGHLDVARAAFGRAATLDPEAQAPRLGLTQVALADGHPAAALTALTEVAGPRRRHEGDEAWTLYFRVHEPDAKTLLGELRAQAR